jgi:hypothetical protein
MTKTTMIRVVAGLISALLFFSMANHYFGWRLFGELNQQTLAATTVLALVVVVIALTHADETHRKGDVPDQEHVFRSGFRAWQFLVTWFACMLSLVVFGPVARMAQGGVFERSEWILLGIVEGLGLIMGIGFWYVFRDKKRE